MRGKQIACERIVDTPRIIPAHAGQTSGHPAWSVPGTDHPRACGANVMVGYLTSADNGSSPRMRGKLVDLRHSVRESRIIPAHAGQTPAW